MSLSYGLVKSKFLEKDQGAANAGKVMKVGADGTLSPQTEGGGGYTLPTASTTVKGGVKVGDGLAMDEEALTLNESTQEALGLAATALQSVPAATSSSLGGVKVGSGLSVASDGTLSAAAPMVTLTINCTCGQIQMAGSTVTVVDKITGHVYCNSTYGSSAMAVYVPKGAVVKVTASDVTIGGITYYAYVRKIITCDSDQTVNYTFVLNPMYGFHISSSESDPEDAVTYLENAVGATPAHMDYDNDTFDYGSWEDAFFMPKPCMLNYDGTVAYYLDPDDYTKKLDGTASDIGNTDFSGNAMMEWPKIWYKVVPDEDDDTSASVYISYIQVDSDYKDWCYIDSEGNHIDHFYTACYNGSLVSSKLRSLSGQTVMQSQTASNEMTYAMANNTVPTDIEWTTECFCDVQLINLLLILMGKSLDTQTVFGNGNCNSGASASDIIAPGTMNDKGLFWGSNLQTVGVKVFGMENWWGNQWRRYAGHIVSSGQHKYKLTYGTQDGSTVTGYNTDGTGYLVDDTFTISGTSGGYISKEKYITNVGMVSKTISGASTTYYTDGAWFGTSVVAFAHRGGNCGNGFVCGAFASALHDAASFSSWLLGAAPVCRPLSTE